MEASDNEKPPVFRSWKGWYWLVLALMGVQLALYLFITYSFS